MRGSELLGRRGQEEEVECDIFATCVGYNDEDYFDDEDNSSQQFPTDSNQPVGFSSLSGDQTQVPENLENQADSDPQQSNKKEKENHGKESPPLHSVRELDEQESQHSRLFNVSTGRRIYFARNPNQNKRDSNNKEQQTPQEPLSTNSTSVSLAAQPSSELASHGKQKRNFKSARGSGRPFRRGQGRKFHINNASLETCPRGACYFEHEDRLAEPEQIQNRQFYGEEESEAVASKAQSLIKSNQKVLSNTTKSFSSSSNSGNQDKWLHDRFEQLQSPLPASQQPIHHKYRKPSNYRHRANYFSGKKLTDQGND